MPGSRTSCRSSRSIASSTSDGGRPRSRPKAEGRYVGTYRLLTAANCWKCTRAESNHRHGDFQSIKGPEALPTLLWRRSWNGRKGAMGLPVICAWLGSMRAVPIRPHGSTSPALRSARRATISSLAGRLLTPPSPIHRGTGHDGERCLEHLLPGVLHSCYGHQARLLLCCLRLHPLSHLGFLGSLQVLETLGAAKRGLPVGSACPLLLS